VFFVPFAASAFVIFVCFVALERRAFVALAAGVRSDRAEATRA
jgi:hypothetical protein